MSAENRLHLSGLAYTLQDIARTYQQVQALSSKNGEQVMSAYGDQMRGAFLDRSPESSVPVMICAHNEAEDLPRLLYALSLHRDLPIKPYVINNNSTDGTEDIAKEAGAVVVTEQNPGLMHALHRGFAEAQTIFPNSPVMLLTDADTFPPSQWASAMYSRLQQLPDTSGGQVIGPVISHGSLTRDLSRTALMFARDARRMRTALPRAHGPNNAIKFDVYGRIAEGLTDKLDTNIALNTDTAVRDVIYQSGGRVVGTINPDAVIFMRGDRYPSLRSILRARRDPEYAHELYGDFLDKKPQGVIYVSPYGD